MLESLTSLLTLTVLEVVLSIDNLVVIAVLVGKLPTGLFRGYQEKHSECPVVANRNVANRAFLPFYRATPRSSPSLRVNPAYVSS
jgi:hypothetical protein